MDERQMRAEVVEHLSHGRKILAVKRVRELSGWSLARAKGFVDDIEAHGDDAVMPAPMAPTGATGASRSAAAVDPRQLESVIEAMLRDGRVIEAIKVYRNATGLGLAEAKSAVEALRDRSAPRPAASPAPSRTPSPAPSRTPSPAPLPTPLPTPARAPSPTPSPFGSVDATRAPGRPRFADDAPARSPGTSVGLFVFALFGVIVTGGALAYLLFGR